MSALRRIYELDFNSGLVRSILSMYYKPDNYYRIPFGRLRGRTIWYDRSINYHAMLGIWEKKNFAALDKVLGRLLEGKDVLNAYDIGANIGLYSLYFSKASPKVATYAFEPVQSTVAHLQKNLDRNQVVNVRVIQKAAAAEDGNVTFYIGHHHKSSLEKDWTSDRGTTAVQEVSVPSITLDTFVSQNPEASPDVIKIDVEGAGGQVLKGASQTLRTKRPILLIESHAAYEDRAIMVMLADFNYTAFRVNTARWVTNPKNDYRDPNGVWGTMLLFPSESAGSFKL